MTTDETAFDGVEQSTALTDPEPVTGEHPGGPRAEWPGDA